MKRLPSPTAPRTSLILSSLLSPPFLQIDTTHFECNCFCDLRAHSNTIFPSGQSRNILLQRTQSGREILLMRLHLILTQPLLDGKNSPALRALHGCLF
jgi:hypothetical protein